MSEHHDATDYRKRTIGDGYTPPLCKDCWHVVHVDSAGTVVSDLADSDGMLCDRYRSLADGVTRIACDAVRNFRCGWQGTGFAAKAAAFGDDAAENMRRIEGGE